MPTRIFYDLIKQSLETNAKLAKDFANFMQAAQTMSQQQEEEDGQAAKHIDLSDNESSMP